MAGDTKHIIQALLANTLIAAGKGVAAVITGSGALLAETIHSAADCGNQGLLLMGVKKGRKPPDAKHPLGYGRVVYFWSFMVALLLFTGGGVFSIYEGIHKLSHVEAVTDAWIGFAILGFSLAIEGWATLTNIRDFNKRRGAKPFFKYLRDTKDSDLVVIFGENAAAVVGLTFALAALFMAWLTGNGRWDAIGSLAIGVVLVGVAIFLAIEVKALLVGESADPEIEQAVREIAAEETDFHDVLNVMTMQQGPGEVLVALKLQFRPDMNAREISDGINRFEVRLREKRPEVRWIFVEPDLRVDATPGVRVSG